MVAAVGSFVAIEVAQPECVQLESVSDLRSKRHRYLGAVATPLSTSATPPSWTNSECLLRIDLVFNVLRVPVPIYTYTPDPPKKFSNPSPCSKDHQTLPSPFHLLPLSFLEIKYYYRDMGVPLIARSSYGKTPWEPPTSLNSDAER